MEAQISVYVFYNELQSYCCNELRNKNERDSKLERLLRLESVRIHTLFPLLAIDEVNN